eukprot:scaffold2482_cov196-Alexandrium_tamarense.AAC.32
MMSTRTWLPIRLVGRRGPMNLLTIRLDVRWSQILPLCLVWFRWRPLLRSSFLFRSAMYFNSLEIGVLSYSFLLSYELLCVLLDEDIRSSRRQFIMMPFCHVSLISKDLALRSTARSAQKSLERVDLESRDCSSGENTTVTRNNSANEE